MFTLAHTDMIESTAMITDGGGKEKPVIDESGGAEENLSTAAASTSLHEGSSVECSSMLFSTGETHKISSAPHGSNRLIQSETNKSLCTAPPLHQCDNTNVESIIQDANGGENFIG